MLAHQPVFPLDGVVGVTGPIDDISHMGTYLLWPVESTGERVVPVDPVRHIL
jgi:hypothetical protein